MPTSPTTGDPDHRLTVALLEGDAVLRLSLELSFDGWGIRLLSAGSVAVLVQALRASGCRPDALVVDAGLGRTTALPAAIDRLLQACGGPMPAPVPVIVTTGNRTGREAESHREYGWSLLEKPYDPESLKALVERLVRAPDQR